MGNALARQFQASNLLEYAFAKQLLLKGAIATAQTECVGARAVRILLIQEREKICLRIAKAMKHDGLKDGGVIAPIRVEPLRDGLAALPGVPVVGCALQFRQARSVGRQADARWLASGLKS